MRKRRMGGWRAEDGRINKDLVAGIKYYQNKPYT